MKYAPLYHYLVALPAETSSVQLTFAEIEQLLGAPLSHRALTSASFWGSEPMARLYFGQIGFRAVMRPGRGVEFTRRTVAP